MNWISSHLQSLGKFLVCFLWEHWLTVKFRTSTVEIFLNLLKKKEGKMQPLNYGPLSISQADGKLTLSIDESVAVGGGSLKGVVSAQGSASVVVHEAMLADAGLMVLEAKFPQFSAEIALVKNALDAELAKL